MAFLDDPIDPPVAKPSTTGVAFPGLSNAQFSSREADVLRRFVRETGQMPQVTEENLDPITAGLYDDEDDQIKLDNSRQAGTLAHELGHATHFRVGEERTKEIADSVNSESTSDVPVPRDNRKYYGDLNWIPIPHRERLAWRERPQEKIANWMRHQIRDEDPQHEASRALTPRPRDSVRNAFTNAMLQEAGRNPDESSLSFQLLMESINQRDQSRSNGDS